VWAPANPDALPRLDYRSWNVSPRYTLDDTAQISYAGGGEEWANSALVTYLRGNGVPTTTRATVTVPAIRPCLRVVRVRDSRDPRGTCRST
jgi:hypothetical protein